MLSLNILVCILLIALICDILSNRIPNYLILIGLVLGFVLQGYIIGLQGLVYGTIGLVLGFAVLFPMYALSGTGAGDVKLMSVIGLFLGHWQNVLVAGCSTLIIGGVCGLAWAVIRKDANVTLLRYFGMLKCLLSTGHVSYVQPASAETAGQRFPYAIAIVSGTLITMYLIMHCSHAYKGVFA